VKRNKLRWVQLAKKCLKITFGVMAFLFVTILGLHKLPHFSAFGPGSAPQVASAKADLAELRGAIDSFRLDCDRYPTAKGGIDALRDPPANTPGWKGPYLNRPIRLDPWGHPYVYQTPGPNGRNGYIVESYGSDDGPGGVGDAADIIDGAD
jgi:type II secretion system protein G